MNDNPPMQNSTEVGFLELFYETLFSPREASAKIKYLRETDSSKLFLYAIATVLLASLGLSSSEGSLGFVIQAGIVWLFQVLILGLLAWLFRSKDSDTDFGLIFFYCAFAQAPLIFLGLAKLWVNSAVLPTTVPSMFCFAWSIALWGWAVANSLRIGNFKAAILVLLAILAPLILIVGLLAFIIISVMSMFL